MSIIIMDSGRNEYSCVCLALGNTGFSAMFLVKPNLDFSGSLFLKMEERTSWNSASHDLYSGNHPGYPSCLKALRAVIAPLSLALTAADPFGAALLTVRPPRFAFLIP